MREKVLYILNNYKTVLKENKTKAEELVTNNVMEILTKQLPFELRGIIANSEYIVKGSYGAGNKAAVPWIAIFDKTITESAQEGYYLVYLFKADMTGVYLSFNQGWKHYSTIYKKRSLAYEKASQLSEIVRNDLNMIPPEFQCPIIDLANGKAELATGYEKCHICGYYYDFRNMPDDRRLKSDLLGLLVPYQELKGKIEKYQGSYEALNNAYLSDQRMESHLQEEKRDLELDRMVEETEVNMTLENKEPPIASNFKSSRPLEIGQKINYMAKQQRQAKLGLLGEKAVLKLEQEHLKKIGITKAPKHISVEQGDGTGYDILSYDEEGKNVYIEVKTTTKGANEPFYLSLSELLSMEEHQSQYKIYRLYDVDYKNKKIGKYYVLDGSNLQNLEIQPINFLVGQGTPDPRAVKYIRALTQGILKGV